MRAKIFKPSKTAMQSGRANTKLWLLVFSDDSKASRDGLMGWHGGTSTVNQVKLNFSTKEEACLLYTSPSPRDATLSRKPS